MAVLNWCYGAKAATVNADVIEKQLWLAHKYRNRLIELERERRTAAEQAARKLHPEFDAVVLEYEAAESAVDAAYNAVKRSRVEARKRVEPTTEQQQAIDDAKAWRARASKELQTHKAAAYKAVSESQKPYRDIAASQIEDIEGESATARKRRVNALYLQMIEDAGLSAGEAEFEAATKRERAECGLYWGTYLIIEDAAKDYRKGAPPKFRRWDGNGSIAVQLQGGLTYDKAIGGIDSRLQLHLPEITERLAMRGKDHGLQARGEAWLRVGSDENRQPIWAVIPFVYHREIPADAVIKWAFLDRRRVGLNYQWKLRLTLETSREQPVGDGGTVAVHMGFRKVPGGLRIATALDDSGRLEELILPESEIGAFNKPYELDSIREKTSNAVMEEFTAWIKSLSESSEWFEQQTETIMHWRGPERLNRLVELWRDHRFVADSMPSDCMPNARAWAVAKVAEYEAQSHYRPLRKDDVSTVFGLMEFWRKFDKHLVEWSANQSRKCRARREQMFRDFAARLCRTYNHLILAKVDWKKLKETPEVDEQDVIETRGRRMSSVASPGRLSEILKEKFKGRETIVPCKSITETCHHCGHHHEFDRLEIETTCDSCGERWDQDHNAVRNTLASGIVMQAKKLENAGEIETSAEQSGTARKVRRNRRAGQ